MAGGGVVVLGRVFNVAVPASFRRYIMALYRTVSPEEATGKVKEVYDDIMATKEIDFIPNFWQALSNNPDHLEATWQKLKTVMKPGKLDPLTKEIIALAVSISNNCTY
jgi:alkylhydroperoxidase/carboxymuconolactone decarboxylase family protein YurZ